MATLEYVLDGYSLEISYNNTLPLLAGEPIRALSNAIDALNEAADLVTFQVTHEASPATDWTYTFETSTGATWTQTLRMTDPPMSSGTFDMFDIETVIERHQTLRRIVAGMIVKYDIETIEATWD